jgi:hypothetical protein
MFEKDDHECQECGRQALMLKEFNEVIGVKTSRVIDNNATSGFRVSSEPFIANKRDVCFPCFKALTKKYVIASIN